MTTIHIHLPEEQAAALAQKATAQGLTLEDWFLKVAEQESPLRPYQRAQAAAARIRAIQQRSQLDPEGWTVQDCIDRGRP